MRRIFKARFNRQQSAGKFFCLLATDAQGVAPDSAAKSAMEFMRTQGVSNSWRKGLYDGQAKIRPWIETDSNENVTFGRMGSNASSISLHLSFVSESRHRQS